MKQLIIYEILTVVIAALSYRAHFLTAGGAVVAFILGSIVIGLGGLSFAIPLLAFFITSSILSRLGKHLKRQASRNFQKGSRRDAGQVLANGGVPGCIVIGWCVFPDSDLYILYLAAIAAVTADTWATEIGLLSSQPPRLVTTWKTTEHGKSGAVSNMGLAGAVLGAFTIAFVGLWGQSLESNLFTSENTLGIVVLSGVLAHLFDSFLGATIQAPSKMSSVSKHK